MSDAVGEPVLSEGAIDIHRLPVEFSAYYAVQRPVRPTDDPPALLIAFHGYAQSCKGFIKNFERLRDRNWLVIAPQGVNQLYWEQGRVGFTWMTKYMREFTIADNMAYMERLLGAVRQAFAFDERQVFLLGFSQGSAMAYRLGAGEVVEAAGVIACGGDLPPDVEAGLGDVRPYPVLIVHGKDDTSMSFDKAVEGEQALREHGWNVDTHYFDGAHELPAEAVDRVVAWMEERTTIAEEQG